MIVETARGQVSFHTSSKKLIERKANFEHLSHQVGLLFIESFLEVCELSYHLPTYITVTKHGHFTGPRLHAMYTVNSVHWYLTCSVESVIDFLSSEFWNVNLSKHLQHPPEKAFFFLCSFCCLEDTALHSSLCPSGLGRTTMSKMKFPWCH